MADKKIIDINNSLNTLEKLIDESSFFKLKNKEAIIEVIYDIKEQLPTVIDDAKKVLNEREKTLTAANLKADQIVTTAQKRAELLVNNSTIMKQTTMMCQEKINAAEQEAAKIIADAQQKAQNIRNVTAENSAKQLESAKMETEKLYSDVYKYANTTLSSMESSLAYALEEVRSQRKKFETMK